MASAIGAFPYKKKLTIKTDTGGAGLGGSLTDFPVCVLVNSDSWGTQAERDLFFSGNNNTAGKRVQFFASDGTTNLAYEVESFTADTSALYWVKVSSLSKSDTANYIYVAYGSDPNGSDQDQGTSVWDSNFVAVHHMASTSDSTSNGNTLTLTNSPTAGTGGVGGNYTLNGSTQRLSAANSASLNSVVSEVTHEAFVKTVKYPTSYGVITALYNTATSLQNTQIDLDSSGKLNVGIRQASDALFKGGAANTAVGTTAYRHVAMTYADTPDILCYLDGASDMTAVAAAGNIKSFNGPLYYGYGQDGYANITIAEGRLSKVARSADWLKATYYSMKSTTWNGDGWLAWSAAEAQWPSRQVYVRQAVTRAATR